MDDDTKVVLEQALAETGVIQKEEETDSWATELCPRCSRQAYHCMRWREELRGEYWSEDRGFQHHGEQWTRAKEWVRQQIEDSRFSEDREKRIRALLGSVTDDSIRQLCRAVAVYGLQRILDPVRWKQVEPLVKVVHDRGRRLERASEELAGAIRSLTEPSRSLQSVMFRWALADEGMDTAAVLKQIDFLRCTGDLLSRIAKRGRGKKKDYQRSKMATSVAIVLADASIGITKSRDGVLAKVLVELYDAAQIPPVEDAFHILKPVVDSIRNGDWTMCDVEWWQEQLVLDYADQIAPAIDAIVGGQSG